MLSLLRINTRGGWIVNQSRWLRELRTRSITDRRQKIQPYVIFFSVVMAR